MLHFSRVSPSLTDVLTHFRIRSFGARQLIVFHIQFESTTFNLLPNDQQFGGLTTEWMSSLSDILLSVFGFKKLHNLMIQMIDYKLVFYIISNILHIMATCNVLQQFWGYGQHYWRHQLTESIRDSALKISFFNIY